MTLKHYTKTSYKLSKKLTTAYSTSFSWGIKVFKPEYRDPIFAIYGFVRIADEIVDTFHSHDKEQLLNKFIDDTWEAINIGISTNPVLHAFQKVVNEYHIDRKLISFNLHQATDRVPRSPGQMLETTDDRAWFQEF